MSIINSPKPIESQGSVSLGKSGHYYSDKIDYPIFCFRHLHRCYNMDNCVNSDKKFSKQLLKKIELISKLSWDEIKLSDRKGHGAEKIARTSIKPGVPPMITDDVKDFLSFYFNGEKGRIIGFRNQSLFHVIFIDTKLDVYKH